MYELFAKRDFYILPNGKRVTPQDLIDNPDYMIVDAKDYVVEVYDDVLSSYSLLSGFASLYGVEYSSDDEQDPQEILDQVLAKKQYLEENPPLTITDAVLTAASFAAISFTDEQAIQVPDLYPKYEVDHAYKKDERFTYNGHLFKVNQDHTSAAQWVPGETGTESLYTNLEMAGDGYLVWTQPTGAHNAYNTGDIVHYPTESDPLYKSLIDGNSWSPDAYPQGWEIYNKE